MTTTTSAPSVMARLRDSTGELHAQAESHPFQRALVSGAVETPAYTAYLQQMLLLHQALESALRNASLALPAIARIVTQEQYQEPYLLEDLRHFAVAPHRLTPTPGARRLIEQILQAADRDPASLLGFHYVLEGANNGNRFIARALRKALNLSGSQGVRYLDPYGDRQREVWSAFKSAMDAESFTESQTTIMIEAAKAMFQGIMEISRDLTPLDPLPPAP